MYEMPCGFGMIFAIISVMSVLDDVLLLFPDSYTDDPSNHSYFGMEYRQSVRPAFQTNVY